MRRLVVATILHAFSFIAIVGGQTDKYSEDLYLVGSLKPSFDEGVEIKIVTFNDSSTCAARSQLVGVVCAASVPKGTTSVRIEIRRRGYKMYALNVPRLTVKEGVAIVNISAVTMIASDLPKVKQIVVGQNNAGGRIFELTLMNKVSHDVLITGINIFAYIRGNGTSCYNSNSDEYEISGQLTLTGGGKGEMEATGEYRETVRASDFAINMTARISENHCDGSASLTLSLPTSFVVPKDSFSTILIIWPASFTIVSSHEGIGGEWPFSNSHLGRFHSFSFRLSTGEKDELDIEAVYPQDTN
jgi:hypothetical protein